MEYISEAQWKSERDMEKTHAPEGASRELILNHYDEDLGDMESVVMVRVADAVAMRILDLVDIWDLAKIYLRSALFLHPVYGQNSQNWDAWTRPCRWPRVSSTGHSLKTLEENEALLYGNFEGVLLKWGKGKNLK